RFEIDHGRHSILERLLPAGYAQAPFVAVLYTRKTILRHRRRQIVADRSRVCQKFIGREDANCVTSEIVGSCPTKTVAVKTRHRIGAAALQLAAKDILRFWIMAVAVCSAHFMILRCGLPVV